MPLNLHELPFGRTSSTARGLCNCGPRPVVQARQVEDDLVRNVTHHLRQLRLERAINARQKKSSSHPVSIQKSVPPPGDHPPLENQRDPRTSMHHSGPAPARRRGRFHRAPPPQSPHPHRCDWSSPGDVELGESPRNRSLPDLWPRRKRGEDRNGDSTKYLRFRIDKELEQRRSLVAQVQVADAERPLVRAEAKRNIFVHFDEAFARHGGHELQHEQISESHLASRFTWSPRGQARGGRQSGLGKSRTSQRPGLGCLDHGRFPRNPTWPQRRTRLRRRSERGYPQGLRANRSSSRVRKCKRKESRPAQR